MPIAASCTLFCASYALFHIGIGQKMTYLQGFQTPKRACLFTNTAGRGSINDVIGHMVSLHCHYVLLIN